MRRTFLSILAIAFVAIFVAATEHAAAQQHPYCCGYTVEAIGLPPSCFPITIVTDWGPGFLQSFTITTNGQFDDQIPNCPPFPALPFSAVYISVPPTCTNSPTVIVNQSPACCVQLIIQ